MNKEKKPLLILMADDDDEDFMLLSEAFDEAKLNGRIFRVKDGEELLDYLLYRGRFEDPETSPRPVIILLDLNMPRMDGMRTLAELRTHGILHRIPIIVLTASEAEDDIASSYELGAHSYIIKPVEFKTMVRMLRDFGRYWFDTVRLPSTVS
jgi:CheY-like chemotaxis protein